MNNSYCIHNTQHAYAYSVIFASILLFLEAAFATSTPPTEQFVSISASLSDKAHDVS